MGDLRLDGEPAPGQRARLFVGLAVVITIVIYVVPYGELIGSEVGLPANELLVIDKHDGLVPFETFETMDDQDFVVRNYVTEVEPDLRRLVVVVDWVTGGAARSHQTSTLIAEKATE